VTKVWLQRSGLVSRAKSRSAHRKKRPWRPMIGMMLHEDGSRYAWVPGDRRAYDLIVTLDDATGEIYSAFMSRRKGRRRLSGGFWRRSNAKACSVRSTPTGAATISIRPRPAGRFPAAS
ncbi:hypothetical protein, partial [Phenylobacterium sp.]|uniref:hypothetical protein n=1 Tax=Phenylobacterium sp. TaxID=1871053 RepID=UPI0025D59494